MIKKFKYILRATASYLTYLFLFILLFIGAVSVGYFANLVKSQEILTVEDMKKEINNISENSNVYFSNGDKVATINYELIRKAIPLSDMGDNIKSAIIASEDATFYSNSGIDYFAILRASYSEASGKAISGGSTLTQQLVKNQLLDSSRSYERKAKEILLSLRVNRNFSKDEILEAYLNMASFGKNKLGQNISGIETASLGIFGISTKELNVAQAAYLAGFVQSPFKYTPFDSNGNLRNEEEIEHGINRQKYVLKRMLDENFITKEEYNTALDFDIKSSFIKELQDDRNNYPYIVSEVITEASEILAKKYAEEENILDKFNSDKDFKNELIEKHRLKFITGGYKVTTTIEKNIYDKLEEAKNSYSGFINKNINGKIEPMQIGATLIENKTGKVLAFIGGRNYENQQLNHANRTYRSPGSTIKPILVYAPAIDKGYITPKSQLLDRRFNFNGWRPENFTRTEYGSISAEDALAKSLNLSTIRLYSAFHNEDPVKEYLEKMNFKYISQVDHASLAAAIGGFSYGVTVTENTNAFSTLANEGQFKQAHIIDEIKDRDGEVIYKANFQPIQIYSKETSYLITKMLHSVITANGTAGDISASLRFNSKNIFAKTGTSEYNHDLWTIGGSKKITFGLWTGYDTPSEINGYMHAHTQWAYFMNTINSINPNIISANEEIVKPETIKNRNINPYDNSNGFSADLVPNNFVQLTKDKAMKKFGSNIDKFTYLAFEKPIIKKEKEDKKEEKQEEKEKTTEQSKQTDNIKEEKPTNITPKETKPIVIKPTEIIVENNNKEDGE